MAALHTFVVPVYGDSPYLESCLQSLLRQSVPGQVLMATSTPTDATKQLAQRYHIPYFINTANKAGIAADWDFALSVADTPWVTIAHQDDVYNGNYLYHIMENVANREDALIAFTDYTNLLDGREVKRFANILVKRALLFPFKIKGAIANRLVKKLMLMPGCPICCPSVAFNKSALNNFKFDANYKCVLDWEAWLRLADMKGAFVYVSKQLMMHRIHAQSETVASINSGARRREEMQLLEKLWGPWLAKRLARLYALGHRNNLT